jgi:peroxiredoxin Q/BCP
MALDVGEVAPTFTLPGIDGTTGEVGEYALDAYRGQPVVLVFYPGDNTPICTRQLNAYTEGVRDFADAGAQVLAISPQSVDSHRGFAQAQGGFAFPLLADEGKRVGQAYGVVGPVGFYRRSAFVVDGKGLVAYAHRAIGGLTFRPTKELVAAVEASRTP